jgi:hypothetical protein
MKQLAMQIDKYQVFIIISSRIHVKLVCGVVFTGRNTVRLLDCTSFEHLWCVEPTKFLPTKFGRRDAKSSRL